MFQEPVFFEKRGSGTQKIHIVHINLFFFRKNISLASKRDPGREFFCIDPVGAFNHSIKRLCLRYS